jgi:transcriptional regulator
MSMCPFHYQEHRSCDSELIGRFIDTFPLALITSRVDGRHYSSHIPLLRDHDGTLFGHADRRNPQFAADIVDAQIFFTGPNTYVPPEGYSTPQLPTWNYLCVHMQATVEVQHTRQQALWALQKSAQAFGGTHSNYRVDPEDPRVESNLSHIVALRFATFQVEARFKLSQNKSERDRNTALEWFLDNNLNQHRQLFQDILALTVSAD